MIDSINKIRNFSIIAHIDHGKSTLADRFLEVTGTVEKRQMRDQILDGMELERERGITIKAKAVRMIYREHVLNLIDTPGHVDFTYEVSRSLAACEGALIVVDASQGVEAQSLANAHLAQENGVVLIPVINKIDLPQSNPEEVGGQIREVLGLDVPPLLSSAKQGRGIEEILSAIIERVPPPQCDRSAPLSALVFDSIYDAYRGVVLYLKVLDGNLKKDMEVQLMFTGATFRVEEVGYLQMRYVSCKTLNAGDVGYAMLGIKDIHAVRVGDTLTEKNRQTSRPHPGYREIKPFVFASFFPAGPAEFESLKAAIDKLHLSDSAFSYQPENSVALGAGFRCGFLGLLHMNITRERLEREFDLSLIATTPSVAFRVIKRSGEVVLVDNPARFPSKGDIETIEEPFVEATLIAPSEYIGPLMQLCQGRRGVFKTLTYLTPQRAMLKYDLPLSEIVVDFYDRLKSLSKGYCSMDYEHIGTRPGDLELMEILIAGEPVDALSFVVHAEFAYSRGRVLLEKLREIIPRQAFELVLQARIGSKIIAREVLRALKKDVTAKCYGGDITRKRKLWGKQKEGKKRMKQFGRVEIPHEAFMALLEMGEEK